MYSTYKYFSYVIDRYIKILLTRFIQIMAKGKSFSERVLGTIPKGVAPDPIKLDVESVDRIDEETSNALCSNVPCGGPYPRPTTRELFTMSEISPATLLIQDIVNSVIETGSPPYSDTLFVDSGFSFQEPKKKERTFGASGLLFPKNCYIGIFPAAYQFCSKEALLTFLGGLDTVDPYEVRDKVKGKFAGCPIGITGGYKLDEPGATYNVFWLDEKTRVYYDPREKKIIDVMPLIIVI
jgi:hypothetical protein